MAKAAERRVLSRPLLLVFVLVSSLVSLPSSLFAKSPSGGYFNLGMDLYRSGRNSEAVEAFEQAIKRKENAREAKAYIERIRKETVERIRNRALTGVNKSSWKNKYFYMNEVDGRIRVGISVQEVFERDSMNVRSGALDALKELGEIIAKAEAARFDVELINESSSDVAPNATLTAQQLTTVYSYISLAARQNLPKF